MTVSRRALAGGLGAAAVAQTGAYFLYRKITSDRSLSEAEPFEYATMDGVARGQDALVQRRDGSELRLDELRGALLLLHFWATWCEPCRMELPQLLRLSRPRTLLVSVDESWSVVDHFFQGKVPPEVVLDSRAEARRAYGVTTLPDTYLLDVSAQPRARFHGPRPWASPIAAETLRGLGA
jgi:thiol-disulfide isomerase/thioredoxin